MQLGFELLHLPLVPQQQRSVFLQRRRSLVLLVLRHLLNERVLLVVGDSWKNSRDRESIPAILLPSLSICFSPLWNRSEGKLVQSQQTKTGAEEEKKPSRKTYSKQTLSNKAICQLHIPVPPHPIVIETHSLGKPLTSKESPVCPQDEYFSMCSKKLVWAWQITPKQNLISTSSSKHEGKRREETKYRRWISDRLWLEKMLFILVHTYPTAYSDKQLPNCFGVIHHDGFHRPVQHFDLLRPLFLLILQNVLRKQGRTLSDTHIHIRCSSLTVQLQPLSASSET